MVPPPGMLMEIGLLGLFSGFLSESETIFRAMGRLYPRSALPRLRAGQRPEPSADRRGASPVK